MTDQSRPAREDSPRRSGLNRDKDIGEGMLIPSSSSQDTEAITHTSTQHLM